MMQVVGYDEEGNEVYGDVMGGDVMGEEDYNPYALAGHHFDVVGAAPAAARAMARKRMMKMPPKPGWRGGQLAPGVIQPDEGLIPLPMAPQAGSPPGQYTATLPQITFQGQLQKPFRAERVLVSVVRTGTSAVGRLLTQFFVGTDLQQAEIAGWDIELVGQANAFGTRLTMKPAQPGVLIRAVSTLSSGLTGTDTIFCSVLVLGRVVH